MPVTSVLTDHTVTFRSGPQPSGKGKRKRPWPLVSLGVVFPLSNSCSNLVVWVQRPVWWSYSGQCRQGHPWRPDRVIVSVAARPLRPGAGRGWRTRTGRSPGGQLPGPGLPLRLAPAASRAGDPWAGWLAAPRWPADAAQRPRKGIPDHEPDHDPGRPGRARQLGAEPGEHRLTGRADRRDPLTLARGPRRAGCGGPAWPAVAGRSAAAPALSRASRRRWRRSLAPVCWQSSGPAHGQAGPYPRAAPFGPYPGHPGEEAGQQPGYEY